MKRLFLPLIVILLVVQAGFGQVVRNNSASFSADWNQGAVVFSTGDTVRCNVRFNNVLPEGVLQVKEGETVLTLLPQDVKSFCFFDGNRKRMRKFYALRVVNQTGKSAPVYMECLYDDEHVSILNHRTMAMPYEYQNYMRFISKPARVSRKYILDEATGQLLPMSRENALRLIDEDRGDVISFIQSRGIRFRSVDEYIDVFQYHRSL